MTNDQIDGLWLHRPSIHDGELMPQLRDFARAIEKATLESAIQQLLAISARQTTLNGSVAAHDCIEAVQKLKNAGGEGK